MAAFVVSFISSLPDSGLLSSPGVRSLMNEKDSFVEKAFSPLDERV